MKHSTEPWKDYTLGEVAEFINGRAFKTTEWEDKGRIIIRIQDLTGKINDPHFTTKIFDPKYLVKKNDLLISWSATLDAFIWNGEDGWLNQHIFKVKEKPQLISRKFLYYLMKKEIDLIRRQIHGSTMKHITKRRFTSLKIKLPSIQIQNEIVSILEKVEQLKQWRRESDKLTADYLNSVFLEMFGNPIHNKKGWAKIQGRDLFRFSSGKSNPIRNLRNDYPYPTFGGNGITGFSKEYLIDYDTIVIGRVGAYCGSIHISKGKSWITDNAIYIRKFKREINLLYLYYVLRFLNLHRFAYYSGQPKITQKPLEELHYMFPPMEMQNRFAKEVEKIAQIKETQKQSKQEIDDLYNCLMQKAFRGELAC